MGANPFPLIEITCTSVKKIISKSRTGVSTPFQNLGGVVTPPPFGAHG